MKQILVTLLCICICGTTVYAQGVPKEQKTQEITVSAESAILMEASTGQIIFEKNANKKLAPASVTKIMTLLLIFDAIHERKISLEDSVTVSEYAASMGGSQVFLEPGETQVVDTMIKCIAVASANDACVAMAEYICGDEKEFVNKMNQRGKELGMVDTHFENCNGLDANQHLTTAHDIALMSKELITKYPQYEAYSTIWMEDITHVTKKGTTKFGLTNTNKLVRQYEYATGLKTGSTSKAKYCVSATAKKDDMELIAVIMAAPDYKIRFTDATTLLNYGFGKCKKYVDEEPYKLQHKPIACGEKDSISIECKDRFTYIDTKGQDTNAIIKKAVLKKRLIAPVKQGDVVGKLHYYLNNNEIGTALLLAKETVDKMDFQKALIQILKVIML
ncbi:MAG: D-alanyl-D-alanine carboxypeptidase family protein [Lachnospiraceae bacterium]